MALNFPSSPVLNQTYQRWTWNGTAWVPTPTVSHPQLPISGGVITGNLGVQGTTSLDGTLTAAGMTNLNTLQANGDVDLLADLDVAGAANFQDGVVIDGVDTADFATKTYVDEAVASGGLWQGTWDAANNDPDLTDVNLHFNGWTWAVVLADPTAPFVIPATPAIPGLSGQTVYNGDHVIWSATASAFEIVPGSSLSLSEAQGMFLPFTGGTITGGLSVGGTMGVTGNATLSGNCAVTGTLTQGGFPVALQPGLTALETISQPGAGTTQSTARIFALNIDCASPNTQIFQLQSSDAVKMWFCVRLMLNNITGAPFRKTILFDTTRLFQGDVGFEQSLAALGASFYSTEIRNWTRSAAVWENGATLWDNGWRFAEGMGLVRADHSTGMIGWAEFYPGRALRQQWLWNFGRNSAQAPGNAPLYGHTLANKGLFGVTERFRSFYRQHAGMQPGAVTNNFGVYGTHVDQPPPGLIVRATFDYYGPNLKLCRYETYMPGRQQNS